MHERVRTFDSCCKNAANAHSESVFPCGTWKYSSDRSFCSLRLILAKSEMQPLRVELGQLEDLADETAIEDELMHPDEVSVGPGVPITTGTVSWRLSKLKSATNVFSSLSAPVVEARTCAKTRQLLILSASRCRLRLLHAGVIDPAHIIHPQRRTRLTAEE